VVDLEPLLQQLSTRIEQKVIRGSLLDQLEAQGCQRSINSLNKINLLLQSITGVLPMMFIEFVFTLEGGSLKKVSGNDCIWLVITIATLNISATAES